jgi:hypothetical protein
MAAQSMGSIPPVVNRECDRVVLRQGDLPRMTGLSLRTIQRWRACGLFPQPDRVVGRTPLWRAETLAGWLSLESGR